MNYLTTKFSVIVPIYNTAEYLHRCIDSIINQGYQNIEIILVNDGSTDKSAIICDEYALSDNRFKVINKKNEGQAVARNIGILAATGDFIEFVDSDDFLNPESFKTFDQAIQSHPEVDIFTANYNRIDATKECINSIFLTNTPLSWYYFLKLRLDLDKFENVGCPLYIVNLSFILKHNLFFEKGNPIEDLLWTPQIILHANKILTLDFTHYNYVKREGSVTQSKSQIQKFAESYMDIATSLLPVFEKIEDIDLKVQMMVFLVDKYIVAFCTLKNNKWSNFHYLENMFNLLNKVTNYLKMIDDINDKTMVGNKLVNLFLMVFMIVRGHKYYMKYKYHFNKGFLVDIVVSQKIDVTYTYFPSIQISFTIIKKVRATSSLF